MASRVVGLVEFKLEDSSSNTKSIKYGRKSPMDNNGSLSRYASRSGVGSDYDKTKSAFTRATAEIAKVSEMSKKQVNITKILSFIDKNKDVKVYDPTSEKTNQLWKMIKEISSDDIIIGLMNFTMKKDAQKVTFKDLVPFFADALEANFEKAFDS